MEELRYEAKSGNMGRVLVFELALTGLLTNEKLDAMRDAIEEIAVGQSCPKVILDLSNAAGWNSAALGMLLSLYKHMKERGGAAWVAGLNDNMASTYQLCGLDRVIPAYNSVEAALSSADV